MWKPSGSVLGQKSRQKKYLPKWDENGNMFKRGLSGRGTYINRMRKILEVSYKNREQISLREVGQKSVLKSAS